MKKIGVKTLWGVMIAMLAMAILLLDSSGAIALLHHYMTSKPQQDLSFSFKSCNKSGNIIKPTVLSEKWESEVLVVTGIAFPNCTSTWLFGSYKLDGNKLSLQYSPVVPKNLATACDCPSDVRYEIVGLKKTDYEISLAEGPYIEYTSLLQKLFIE